MWVGLCRSCGYKQVSMGISYKESLPVSCRPEGAAGLEPAAAQVRPLGPYPLIARQYYRRRYRYWLR